MHDLDSWLDQLEQAQLLRHLVEPDPAYLSKHAHTQETAYETLLRKKRREVHRRVAESYERLHGDPHEAASYGERSLSLARELGLCEQAGYPLNGMFMANLSTFVQQKEHGCHAIVRHFIKFDSAAFMRNRRKKMGCASSSIASGPAG